MEKDQSQNTTSEENLSVNSSEDDKIDGQENVKNSNEKNDKEIELLPEEIIAKLEDKLARTYAEMENQRRRFEKEKDDAFEYGGYSFAKEALSLIDNLERSKQILKSDDKLKNTEALKQTLEHLEIINKDLMSIFNKNNIKVIECINQKLDPNFHQAMMEIEDDHKEPGTIIQEIQKGFTIKDRLLRPSLVGVSKKVQNKVQETQKNEENKENN